MGCEIKKVIDVLQVSKGFVRALPGLKLYRGVCCRVSELLPGALVFSDGGFRGSSCCFDQCFGFRVWSGFRKSLNPKPSTLNAKP